MHLPPDLQSAIDLLVQNTPETQLRKAREALSANYQEGKSSPFSDEAKRLAYLASRMAATYGACFKVLQNISLSGHLLDLGAGPGTASWAAAELFPDLKQITLIEKSREAIELGKTLAQSHPLLKNSSWRLQSLSESLPKADAAIVSYVLGELSDPIGFIQTCWKTIPLLILIEPGTPKGFELIRKIREELLLLNAHLIAPCPHRLKCPMEGTNWCHFAARIERTRLHRLLKSASLGYEDEKFSYLIASQTPHPPSEERVIRRPIKLSGRVEIELCTKEGSVKKTVVSRKHRSFYKQARDLEWGETFNFNE